MKKLKYLYLFLFLFLLSSCIKEIKIKTDTIEKLPVINCIFSPDSVFKVYVCLPIEITSAEPYYVEDANVTITGNNNTKLQLYYTGKNGIYKSTQKPKINVLYTLEAKVQDYKTVKASDMIPEPVVIDNVEYYYDYDVLNNDSISMSRITFTDDYIIENFYDYNVFFINEDGKKIYSTEPHYFKFTPDNVLLAEGDIEFFPNSFFFSDDYFNGQTYILSVPFGNSDYKEFRTTSKSYYLFRKFWTRHYYYQNNDRNIGNGLSDIDFLDILNMSDPIEMYTNIENGYGIFAGYSCDVWLY